LCLGLITKNDQGRFRRFGKSTTSGLGDTRVNTTTKTTVRGSRNIETLGIISSLGFSIGEKSYINL
jgi:hypothetical protein